MVRRRFCRTRDADAVPIKQRAGKELRPQFSAEVLELFRELEGMRRQTSEDFIAKLKRLAGLLNLRTEWWATCHVNDASLSPPWPPHMRAFRDWHRVREVREQLLEAVGLTDAAEYLTVTGP